MTTLLFVGRIERLKGCRLLIEALPGTVPEGEQPKWEPITADGYLQERLREIKLA